MQWVLLAYRLPREPSTPRIAVWRKLRRLGAVQLLDGLVGLPHDARTQEQLEWLAEEVAEAGGEAGIWLAQPATAAQERALAERMQAGVADDYRVIIEEAEGMRDPAATHRTLGRLRRALRRVRTRDYFPPAEAERARRAVDELAEKVEAAP
ncbi:MAG: Chromate resistance protein ChrB [Actinomycetota bacterium]